MNWFIYTNTKPRLVLGVAYLRLELAHLFMYEAAFCVRRGFNTRGELAHLYECDALSELARVLVKAWALFLFRL